MCDIQWKVLNSYRIQKPNAASNWAQKSLYSVFDLSSRINSRAMMSSSHLFLCNTQYQFPTVQENVLCRHHYNALQFLTQDMFFTVIFIICGVILLCCDACSDFNTLCAWFSLHTYMWLLQCIVLQLCNPPYLFVIVLYWNSKLERKKVKKEILKTE